MHFIIPQYFIFLLPLAIIVTWKFLHPVPKLVVPCLRMWLGEEKIRSSSLYRYFPMMAAILFSLLLIFALSSPFTIERRSHFLIILDNSASMAACETDLTRWQRACDLVETYQHRGNCSIITMAPTPELTGSGLSLRRITPGLFHGNPVASVKFARNLLNFGEQPVIISDGVGIGWRKALKKIRQQLPGVIVHLIGKSKNNVGLSLDGQDYLPGQISYRVIIQNFSEREMWGNFSWSWKQGGKSSSGPLAPFHLQGREIIKKNIIVVDSGDNGVLRCRIDTKDSLPLDNSLRCIVRKRKKARVLVVSDEPVPYIMGALSCYPDWIDRPRCSITSTLENQPLQNYDFIISTKKNLAKLPAGHSLIFGSKISSLPFGYQPKTSPVSYSHVNAVHPLAYGLSTENLVVQKAWPITNIPVNQILIYASYLPLIFTGHIQTSQYVYLAFSLADSNFAQQAIFPIFIYNCVLWAMQSHRANDNRFACYQVPTGEQNIAPSRQLFQKSAVKTMPHKKKWRTMLMTFSFLLVTISAGIIWMQRR